MDVSKEVRSEIWELTQKGMSPGLIEKETGYNRDMVTLVLREPHLSGRISSEDHKRLWAYKLKGYSRKKVAEILGVTFEEVKALWRKPPEREQKLLPSSQTITDSRLADFLFRSRKERELRISELEQLQRLRFRARLPIDHKFKTDEEIRDSMDWLAKHS